MNRHLAPHTEAENLRCTGPDMEIVQPDFACSLLFTSNGQSKHLTLQLFMGLN